MVQSSPVARQSGDCAAGYAQRLEEERSNIFVWDIGQSSLTQLTSDDEPNHLATWFRDSKRVAFSVVVEGLTYAFWRAADGAGAPLPVRQDQPTRGFPVSFTPDGKLFPMGVGGGIGLLSLDNREPLRYL